MNKLFTKIATSFVGIAMAVGVGVAIGINSDLRAARAEEETATWTATSGGLGSGVGSGTITDSKSGSWSYARTLVSGSSYTGWTSNCIQLGKNGGVENLTLTTTAYSSAIIKSVSVQCSSYKGKHNVSITVGESTYLSSTSTSSWTTVDTKSGSGTSSGTITISFTGGTRALYIKSVSVTYDNDVPTKTLSSISVSSNHRTFEQNDEFVKETVTATYSDSSTKDVTDSAVFSNPDMSTTGTKTVTVSYTEDEITKDTSYQITVNAPSPKITVSPASISGYRGQNSALTASASNITPVKYVWRTSNSEYIKISNSSETTVETASASVQIYYYGDSHLNGNVYVKAVDANSVETPEASVDVEILESSHSLSLSPSSSQNINVGGTVSITATSIGTGYYSSTNVTATTSDASKVKVDGESSSTKASGSTFVLSGIALGNATVTFTTANGDSESIAVTVANEQIVDFVFADIATEEGWENGVAYTPVIKGSVTIEGNGGGNNGKWYTSSGGSWRMYSGGTVRISVENGSITSVTSDPSCDFEIEDGVATFSPSARTDFTQITVTYSGEAPVEYTIQYNSNGGSGTMESTVGTAPKVAECTFTAPTGKSFERWNDSSDGSGTDYSVGETIKQDIILYAIWVKPVGPVSDYFTQITSTSDISSDAKYVIVYGDLIFDGSLEALDASSNHVAMSLDNLITSYFTIDNGKIKSASGYWIGNTSNSNALMSSTTEEYENTVSIDEDGNLVVVSSGGAYLRYNKTSGQERFRYYKSGSYSSQQAIQLYKVNVSKVIVDYITCDPTGTTSPTGISWSTIESYFGTLSSADKNTLKATSASETGTIDQQAMARYDYIVGKYGTSAYNDFIGRNPSPIGHSIVISAFLNKETTNTAIIVVVTVVATALAVGGYFLLHKKKED